MSAVVLSARSLSAGYGQIPVVDCLDLHVGTGEIVALMGPNGAGKSTVLKALAGVLAHSGGEIDLLGETAPRRLHRRARRGLRYVPEERSVIRGLTVYDNLRLGSGAVAEGVELFPELKPLLKRRAGLLSGGEQQMLTLACALSGGPVLVLVDELSLGLAPIIVQRLLASLDEAAQRGVGVLLVEQQVRTALKVAKRGYVMVRGSIAMSGTARELEDREAEIEATYFSGLASQSGD